MTKSQSIEGQERRRNPRMIDPVPVSVRGSELGGKRFRFETIARNVGAGGLCAYAPRLMRVGETVSMRIRFARLGSNPLQAPEISVRGLVVRTEARPGGLSLFAVSFLLRNAA